MKFKNISDRDFAMIGVQCAAGDTVTVPERIAADPHKLALLRKMLTEVVDAPSPIAAIDVYENTPEPEADPIEPSDEPAVIRQKRGRRGR